MPTIHKPGPRGDAANAVFGFDPDLANSLMMPPKALSEIMSAWSTESLRFAGQRLRAQAELMDRLRGCATFKDMVEHQIAFVRKANTDYAEEFGVLAELARTPANGESRPTTETTRVPT